MALHIYGLQKVVIAVNALGLCCNADSGLICQQIFDLKYRCKYAVIDV